MFSSNKHGYFPHSIVKMNKTSFSIKRTTKFFFAIVIALLTGAGCGGGQSTESLSDLKAKEAELKTQLAELSSQIAFLEGDSLKKAVLVETRLLKAAIFKTYINVQGRVDAEESVSLSAEMPGTITRIHVKNGDRVNKGQILAETDARALQQSLADLQINAELINQIYEKQKSLWEQKIGTEVQLLQAKTQKESMEKKITALQEQIKMTRIISPIDGTVDAVDVKLGQLTAPGLPAIRVVNLGNLKVKAEIAESYAMKVHKGDEALVIFPDSKDTLKSALAYASRVINRLNRTFEVEAPLNDKREFHPNQIAILSINDYRSAKPVIALEINYVRKDLNGDRYVMIAENNRAVRRNVVTGKEYGGQAEITEGLHENDNLIEAGFENLNEGDVIEVKK
jgi:membrane fusion protein, multidrug efflux system